MNLPDHFSLAAARQVSKPADSDVQGAQPESAQAFLAAWHGKIEALRLELTELAVILDRRRQPEAADIAMMVGARLKELEEEFGLSEGSGNFMKNAATGPGKLDWKAQK